MDAEMLKGHLDMIVLAALAGGPSHGYGIIQEIKRRNHGAFDLREGTIYPTLHRLEKAGYLASHRTARESGRKRNPAPRGGENPGNLFHDRSGDVRHPVPG